ncbi:MAG: CBS domain-containing protein [Pyrinomonadaceae bacterium]
MYVKDVMNKTSVVCTEDVPLAQVYRLMQENDCDYITVVESYAHRMPIGVITEHEICFQIIGKGRDPRGLTAASVMNTNVIKAPYTLTVTDCSNLMETKQAKRALVVNEDGMFCGTLTDFDLKNTKDKLQTENVTGGEEFARYDAVKINRIY